MEDRVTEKLRPWAGKHATMPGHSVFVKSVLTSVVIYFITVLDMPLEDLLKIDSIPRDFLWAACEKVNRGKCKVNWEHVCEPKNFEGFGILNLKKLSMALCLRCVFGSSGMMSPSLGSDLEIHVTKETSTCLRQRRRWMWAMATNLVFWNHRGCLGGGQRTWPP